MTSLVIYYTPKTNSMLFSDFTKSASPRTFPKELTLIFTAADTPKIQGSVAIHSNHRLTKTATKLGKRLTLHLEITPLNIDRTFLS